MIKNKRIDKKVVIVIVQLILLNVLYLLTNKLDMRFNLTYTAIDNYIPFVKYMIVPYDLWYVYIWCGLLYVLYKNKDVFFIHAKVTIAAKIICIVGFLIYPTYTLRPEIVGSGIFDELVRMTYANDNPVNALPSLHVLQSVLTHIAIAKGDEKGGIVTKCSLVMSVSIVISTMMTKQHSLLDVVAGVVLSFVAAGVGYWKYNNSCDLGIIKKRKRILHIND